MIISKGKKKGIIHTMDIELSDIWAVFFPADFNQKYKYLGAVPWNTSGDIFKVLEPLVIFMDYKAKPWWCPRWFLRLLHLFGNDNSIVRVRNWSLHNLYRHITKGYMITDYKTKWNDYDLRIHIIGDEQCYDLAFGIENLYYNRGRREELVQQIKAIDPNTKFTKGYPIDLLEKELNRLEDNYNE